MATITYNIEIGKARVLDEVAKTTAYIGSKAVSEQDPGAYVRVAVVDANREQLDRYWMESCSDASVALNHWASSIRSQVLTHHPEIGSDRDFKVSLAMPTNWADVYENTVTELLTSYLVNAITAKWLLLTLPTQAEAYAALASGALTQAMQLLLARKRPARRSSGGGGESEGATWAQGDTWNQPDLWQYT